MKILVVDENEISLLTIVTYLKQLKHDVISIADPSKTFELYKTESPDLIILDATMKTCSGFDCAKQIRQHTPHDIWIPIIFLNTHITDQFVKNVIESGGDDYLIKPVSAIALKAKITAMNRITKMQLQSQKTNAKLQELSTTDILTNLPNRYLFESEMKKTVVDVKKNNQQFALLFIDIDHFKSINDTLGHKIGDLLLIELSKHMLSIINETDFIARLGGDEFAIILKNSDSIHRAGRIAKKLISTLHNPISIHDHYIQLSASIGIACFPHAGRNYTTLIKNADIAMYRAKSSGRNNYQYFTEKLNIEHQEKSSMEQALHNSIINNELYLLYQPKYELNSLNIIGMEALLRWKHPPLKNISPEKFITLAEETGFIIELGNWVFDTVCKQYDDWHKQHNINIPIAINLSPYQILKGNIVKHIKSLLDRYQIPANCIELEITETAIIAYSIIVEDTLNALHDMGIKLYIDDFGTGYSSLSHLKKLPIDALKIDKEFVMDMLNDENDAAIVKSMILLAHSLGLDVIAEGVETKAQLDFLVENNCLKGQGFYLSKPLTAKKILDLFEKS